MPLQLFQSCGHISYTFLEPKSAIFKIPISVKNLQSKYFLLTLMNTKYCELSKIFTFERRYIIFYSYQNISRV